MPSSRYPNSNIIEVYSINLWAQLLISLVWFDFIAQYLIHASLHKQRLLWRLHKVHNSDEQVDVSTGTRLQQQDYLCPESAALLALAVIGAAMAFYRLYRLLTLFFTYPSHANIQLPGSLD